MSLTARFRPEALEDLAQARDWYDAQRPGLGDELLRCVEAAVAAAVRSPGVYPRAHGEVRRALVRRFPYAVYYRSECRPSTEADDGPEEVLVLAVAHVSRAPRFGLDRS